MPISASRSMSRSRDREHPLSAEGLPASLETLERCGPSRPPSKRNAGQINQRDFYDYRFVGLDIEVPSLRRGDTPVWASGVRVSPPRRRKGSIRGGALGSGSSAVFDIVVDGTPQALPERRYALELSRASCPSTPIRTIGPGRGAGGELEVRDITQARLGRVG